MRILYGLASVVVALWCATGAAAAESGSPGTLSVVAGVVGESNVGTGIPPVSGSATSAHLNGPTAVATDSAGDVYVADSGDNVVVKITATGTLSVVAGTGVRGTPSPGPATQSDLNDPYALAVDPAGDLYIADLGNDMVEKVTPAGMLSVVAGTGRQGAPTPGPATASDLGRPVSVAVGPTGDLYVADLENNDIEEVTPAGTLSITVGAGRVNSPDGVAVDSSGDLYIADAGGAILKLTPQGRLSTVAGMLRRSGGPTPGPATQSLLGGPMGMAVDAAGDLYIADFGNSCVEEVTPGGVLSVIAGTGATALPGTEQLDLNTLVVPQGIAVSANGALYMASSGSGIVEEMADAPDARLLGRPTTAVGSPHVRGTGVTQTLSCLSGDAPCSVTATLRTTSRGSTVLARRKLVIAVGRYRTITLVPNRIGKLLLRRLGTLRVTLTITTNQTTFSRRHETFVVRLPSP